MPELPDRESATGSVQPELPDELPGAWSWWPSTDRVVLSDWVIRDRELPDDLRITTGERMLARVHPEDRGAVAGAFELLASDRRPFALVYRTRDGRDRYRTVATTADAVPDGTDSVLGATVNVKTAVTRGRYGDAPFLDAVLDALTEGLVACTRTGAPILVNGAARRLYERATGNAWDEQAGRLWVSRLLGTPSRAGQLAPWRGPVDLALSGTAVDDVEVEVGGEPGSRRVVLLSARPVSPVAPTAAQGAVVTLHDVTEQRAAETLVAREATHDRVTGLPNRRTFFARLAAALAAPGRGPVAVVLVEVRDLSELTATYGYAAAERAITAATWAIAPVLGPHDFAAAPGDDRIAVMCTDSADRRAEDVALRVVRAVGATRAVVRADDGAGGVALTARAGVAFADDDMTPVALLRRAEAAVADAADGGIAVHGGETALVRALRAALANDELVLHYQPKVALATGRVVGVEALVRWQRPGHGLVPPSEFVGVAERAGLASGLGRWVLGRALCDVARWVPVAPPGFRVSVNVSPAQLRPGFADEIRAALVAAGVAPGALCIEVTESLMMHDVGVAADMLRALREHGVAVSIDDFGTGYSSLAYLRDFPADELKIDRSFVVQLGMSGATALVGGVVSIAHALHLDTVAEGVETAEQLAALETAGCDVVQGFLFARPMPAAGIDALLASTTPLRAAGGVRADEPGLGRVLVADDADDVRQLARMSLLTAGYEVHEAADGGSAIERALGLRPDVVLLDVHMPDNDGFAVCRALRADPATASCTVVMLTATADAADKIAAYEAGADDYVVKPFSPRELVSRVRAAQRRRGGGAGDAR